MHYYSTRNKNESVDFAQAALTGLAPDGGLFVPEEIPRYTGPCALRWERWILAILPLKR